MSKKLAELVAAKTGGDFVLNISYGGLSKNRENLDGISIGAFEMAQFCAGYHRDKNPTITVWSCRFWAFPRSSKNCRLESDLRASAAQKDLARWNAKLLMPSPMPQYNIVGKGAPRASLADFEGMRVRATAGSARRLGRSARRRLR